MLSRFIITVAVVLLVCSVGANADIGMAAGSIYQYQNFVVGDLINPQSSGLNSILTVSHGENAFAINALEIYNEQSVPAQFGFIPLWGWDWCDECPTKANQWQSADIKQTTEAESDCGIITVSAFLTGFGIQEQAIGSADFPKVQEQTLGVLADQVLLATGNAEGTAINDADDVQQEQFGRNGAGSMDQFSVIDAFQMSDVEGNSNTTVTALNSMMATTTQTQTVF